MNISFLWFNLYGTLIIISDIMIIGGLYFYFIKKIKENKEKELELGFYKKKFIIISLILLIISMLLLKLTFNFADTKEVTKNNIQIENKLMFERINNIDRKDMSLTKKGNVDIYNNNISNFIDKESKKIHESIKNKK